MIVEPRSSATILALADLAELSANQLADGHSIEDVIETLRKAALTVRKVVKDDEEAVQDAEMEAVGDAEAASEKSEEAVTSDISA